MIVALAGRRIDEANTDIPRFPLKNVPLVEKKLRDYLQSIKPLALVCSAACGADLIALEIAGELKITRRIILPFEPIQFKKKSVLDRPGQWGEIFDGIFNGLRHDEKVIILNYAIDDGKAYEKTNNHILDQAEALFQEQRKRGQIASKVKEGKVVLAIWEGYPKTEQDTTKHLFEEAKNRGFMTKQINTLA